MRDAEARLLEASAKVKRLQRTACHVVASSCAAGASSLLVDVASLSQFESGYRLQQAPRYNSSAAHSTDTRPAEKPVLASSTAIGPTGPKLRIWGRTSSVNVQKVLWTLGQLGVPFVRYDTVLGGPAQDDDYLSLNPHGKIPTIVDTDGTTLYESNAIIRYLCAKYGDGTLWQQDPAVRARADLLMDLQQTQFNTDSVKYCHRTVPIDCFGSETLSVLRTFCLSMSR